MHDRNNNLKMFAPPLTDKFYAESYQLRKAASSMTSAFIAWFEELNGLLVEETISQSDKNNKFSILSIGSGEGDIDIKIIENASKYLERANILLKYVAIEPNPIHRQYFLDKLQEKAFDESKIEVCIHETNFGENNDRVENYQNYNLVLLSHVLYYFDDPYRAVQQALAQTKSTGKIVIVHQEETGIPHIQNQYMMSLKGDTKELLTADRIKRLLADKERDYYYKTLDARLDVTECLAGSPEGIKIMSFCMECDLRHLGAPKLERIFQAFRSLADFEETGRAFIKEPIGVFVLPSFGKNNFVTKVLEDRDPTQDYVQLAKNFDWSSLLSKNTNGEPLRILDVACGTGRWLQALQHYVKLEKNQTNIIYDLLEPNSYALADAVQNMRPPFQLGERYTMTIQEAKLEEKAYDLLWSMHGFYTIPRDRLSFVLRKSICLLNTTGVGFIALATRKSFYIDFYDQYLNSFCEGKRARFTSAEEVSEALSKCGIKHNLKKIIYEERVHIEDSAAIKHYIKTESIINSFDQSRLANNTYVKKDESELTYHPHIRAYLDSLIR